MNFDLNLTLLLSFFSSSFLSEMLAPMHFTSTPLGALAMLHAVGVSPLAKLPAMDLPAQDVPINLNQQV